MARTEVLASRLLCEVPLFLGLTPGEMRAFVAICRFGSLARGETLCEVATPSNRLYILLSGEIEVIGTEDTVVAVVKPVSVVGEMGFITRRARSASLRARTELRLLNVEHNEFEALADGNPVLRAKVYRNMIRILADRLTDANSLVSRYRRLAESAGPPDRASGSPVAALGRAALAAAGAVSGPVDAARAVGESGDSGPPKGAPPVAAGAIPGAGEPLPGVGGSARPAEVVPAVDRILALFYELVASEPDAGGKAEDREHYRQLRSAGYSDDDIEFAARWAARSIASIRRFGLVRLSIGEAFQGTWSG